MIIAYHLLGIVYYTIGTVYCVVALWRNARNNRAYYTRYPEWKQGKCSNAMKLEAMGR